MASQPSRIPGTDWEVGTHRVFQLFLFLAVFVILGYALYQFVRINNSGGDSANTDATTTQAQPGSPLLPSFDDLKKTATGEMPLQRGTLFVLVFLGIFSAGFLALVVAAGIHLYERSAEERLDLAERESLFNFFGRRRPSILNGRTCIDGDGNCLFRSIAVKLGMEQGDYLKVKEDMLKRFAEIMKERPEDREWGPQVQSYIDVVDKDEVEEELEEAKRVLEKDGEWGDHLLLRFAADMYGKPLRMLALSKHKGKAYLTEESKSTKDALDVFSTGSHFEVDLEVAMDQMRMSDAQKEEMRKEYEKLTKEQERGAEEEP